jgi:hypothetical protein
MSKIDSSILAEAILITCKENEFTNCEMKSLVKRLEGMIDSDISKQTFSFRDSDKVKEILINHGYSDCLSLQKFVNSKEEAE